jgi:hypothetical protein
MGSINNRRDRSLNFTEKKSGCINISLIHDPVRFNNSGWAEWAAYQEESIDKNVKEECWETVARVVVVPHADLDGNDRGRVDEKKSTRKHHAWNSVIRRCVHFIIRHGNQQPPCMNLD